MSYLPDGRQGAKQGTLAPGLCAESARSSARIRGGKGLCELTYKGIYATQEARKHWAQGQPHHSRRAHFIGSMVTATLFSKGNRKVNIPDDVIPYQVTEE